jgi:hypothetical protein
MNTEEQVQTAKPNLPVRLSMRRRLGVMMRRWMLRALPPYARYSVRQATTTAKLDRLEKDFEHFSKRHTEQIERLEDLVNELVLTAESLRREIARDKDRER